MICIRHCYTCKDWKNSSCESEKFKNAMDGHLESGTMISDPENFDCRFYKKIEDRRVMLEKRKRGDD